MTTLELPAGPLQAIPSALKPQLLDQWSAFAESAPELARELAAAEERLDALVRVWSGSRFVAQSCGRHPTLLADLIGSGDLDRACDRAAFSTRLQGALDAGGEAGEPDVARSLRRFRRREMVRIAWRDLAGLAALEETLSELTWLAEELVDEALTRAHAQEAERFGEPQGSDGGSQRLIVIGMGKLGGGELNYSSDIDLIFVYPSAGETSGPRSVDNAEFFRRVGQRLIKILNEPTADGFVFRVDMRLRPFGDAGPLVTHGTAFEDYYQAHGREWERYAFIKARPIAGDLEAGERLLRNLRPFVYRRYLDFGSIESLREMKAMIAREVERRGLQRNVKLGPGGIREIEFIAQVFQLIYGGRRPVLRCPSIQPVLDMLAANGDLPETAVTQLKEAYRFLRRTENRLQYWDDQQTHDLPADDSGKARLAFSMGFACWSDYVAALMGHVDRVKEQFASVFAAPREDTGAAGDRVTLAAIWEGQSDAPARETLAQRGYGEPERIFELLVQLRRSRAFRSLSANARRRLDQLMPLLMGAAARVDNPDETVARVLSLVETVATRSVYLALLIENAVALTQLVKLCSASPWIAHFLGRHPLLLDELLYPAALYEPLQAERLDQDLSRALESLPDADLEQQMDTLRHFQQVNTLRVAAADINAELRLMVVSDYLTWIAEAILKQVLRLAWEELVARFGSPRYELEGARHEAGFAIVAYGKLGGIELGYGSDLDLVFLHDSEGEKQHTDGERQLDNQTFFARLAQRIVHIMATRTSAGVLYEVDTRLRPSGRSGLLVTSVNAFAEYQRNQAWTWEHQALVRARPVAGSAAIAERFMEIRAELLRAPRDRAELRQEVCAMRERMRRELGSSDPEVLHLKQDPGGIVDIEFMVQYAVLAEAREHQGLVRWTDNIRQLDELENAGIMSSQAAALLRDAYRAQRRQSHRLKLQEESSLCPVDRLEPELKRQLEAVAQIWKELMEPDTGSTVE